MALVAPVTERTSYRFYNYCKWLEQFYEEDFQHIDLDLLPRKFPRSWPRRNPCNTPLVRYIAEELAPWYRRPPTRTFQALAGGEWADMSSQQSAILSRFYAALDVDSSMKSLSEKAVPLRTMLGVIRRPPGGGLSVQVFSPSECRVWCDPYSPQELSQARRLEFRVPLTCSEDETSYGKLVMTRYEITVDGRGEWTADGTNPWFSDVNPYPVFLLRTRLPMRKGTFFAHPSVGMYDAQVQLSLGYGDYLFVSSAQSHGQRTLSSNGKATLPTEMEMGADTILPLQDDEKYEVVASQTNLSPYLSGLENLVKLSTSMNALNPQALLDRSALTAAAKRIDLAERTGRQYDVMGAVRKCEQQFFTALIRALRWNDGLPLDNWPDPREVRVGVEHHETDIPLDPLHEAQAFESEVKHGLTSAVTKIRQRSGVSRAEAMKIVQQNIDDTKALMVMQGAVGG